MYYNSIDAWFGLLFDPNYFSAGILSLKLQLISTKFFSKVARFLMKTVSQLGSGKMPVGTTTYMGRAEQLMQCHCGVQRGNISFSLPTHFFQSTIIALFQSIVYVSSSLCT